MVKRKRQSCLNAVSLVLPITQDDALELEGASSAIASARVGDTLPLLELVRDRLSACEVIEAHGIIHDKDEHEVWDEAQGRYVRKPMPPRVHIVLKFRNTGKYNGARTLPKIAEALGVAPVYIQKPCRGAHAYEDLLIHLIGSSTRHQYRPDEVKSIVHGNGKPYAKHYMEQQGKWIRHLTVAEKEKASPNLETVLQKIRNGEISKRQMLLTPELYNLYGLNKRRCNDAFNTYAELEAARAAVNP